MAARVFDAAPPLLRRRGPFEHTLRQDDKIIAALFPYGKTARRLLGTASCLRTPPGRGFSLRWKKKAPGCDQPMVAICGNEALPSIVPRKKSLKDLVFGNGMPQSKAQAAAA